MAKTLWSDRFRRLSPNGTVFKSVKITITVPCEADAALLFANDGLVSAPIFLAKDDQNINAGRNEQLGGL